MSRTLAEIVRALDGAEWTDEDGRKERVRLMPPATAAQIAALESELPRPLPGEVRELLELTSGLEGSPFESVHFAGSDGFGLDEVFPCCVPISHDGFGNYWVVDVTPNGTVWGPVYYACHDAPVIVYQAADLAEFLGQMTEMMKSPGAGNPVDFVHEDAVSKIWAENPSLMEAKEAAESGDAELAEFAKSLEPRGEEVWRICDLRSPRIGDGFSWGRYHHMEIRRCGEKPIFAMIRTKKTFFEKLFKR